MEKFGIFELLDALSALTASEAAPKKEEEFAQPPAHDPAQGPAHGSAHDPAFDPPVYGKTGPSAALDTFLARHDKTTGKVKK